MARTPPPLNYSPPMAPDCAERLMGTRLYVVRDISDAHPDTPWCIKVALTHFDVRGDADLTAARFVSPRDAKAALLHISNGLVSMFAEHWEGEDLQAKAAARSASLVKSAPAQEAPKPTVEYGRPPSPLDDFDLDESPDGLL